MKTQFDYIIGIDTGTKTGFAVWSIKDINQKNKFKYIPYCKK
jgi:hypothetical protein